MSTSNLPNLTTSAQRPSRSLHGRVAIVTGAGSAGDGIGNGRAAALLLAEAGACIVCVDLDASSAEMTSEMICAEAEAEAKTLLLARENAVIAETEPKKQKRAISLCANVTDQQACQRIVDAAVEEYGRIDILVNNVGIMGPQGTAVEVDMAAWTTGMEVNVASMVMMAKAVIPIMARNEDGSMWKGSIVNMASVAGLRGGTPSLLYPTSKGAIVNMTRAMAAHHAPQGIRVNCVCPGMLYTPMMYGGGMSEEKRAARRERSLLKTEGSGWDAGAAVRFLAGDEARWITGTVLTVDAGTTCTTSLAM